MKITVHYKQPGDNTVKTVRARKLTHHAKIGETVTVEVIPENDPGGSETLRLNENEFVRATGHMTVYPHTDSSGKYKAEEIRLSPTGDWEATKQNGEITEMRTHWKKAR